MACAPARLLAACEDQVDDGRDVGRGVRGGERQGCGTWDVGCGNVNGDGWGRGLDRLIFGHLVECRPLPEDQRIKAPTPAVDVGCGTWGWHTAARGGAAFWGVQRRDGAARRRGLLGPGVRKAGACLGRCPAPWAVPRLRDEAPPRTGTAARGGAAVEGGQGRGNIRRSLTPRLPSLTPAVPATGAASHPSGRDWPAGPRRYRGCTRDQKPRRNGPQPDWSRRRR